MLPWSVWAQPARKVGQFKHKVDADAFRDAVSAAPVAKNTFRERLSRLR